MLVQIKEDKYINTDYIIELRLVKGNKVWDIHALMIDATLILLGTFTTREEAEIAFHKLISDANVHMTKVMKAHF